MSHIAVRATAHHQSMFTTQKGSGEVSFNPHGAVFYGPAKRTVCNPKKDYNRNPKKDYNSCASLD
jgi:hypothetical protein